MVLNQAQAEAVYSAMCALNTIGNVTSEFNMPNDVWVQSRADGAVFVVPTARGAKLESHKSQAAFAAAYGLQ